MLSIHAKKGSTAEHVAQVADYPDEQPEQRPNQQNRPGTSTGAIEDYYSQSNGGTPSIWVGAGAETIGLAGQAVERETMTRLLQGFHPDDGRALVDKAGPQRRYGYDLTFSAPKSVSIVWAVADRDLREAIATAHDAAVAQALRHIEAHLPVARRGHAGEERELAHLITGVYRHASSREQDPQIHSHALLMNLAQRLDGTWGAIESWEIYRHKMALGALYRAVLAQQLQEMGFGIERDGDSFRILGVSEDAEREFSRRRQQIEKLLLERGRDNAQAAALATLDTRRRKEVVDRAILAADWRERAAHYGLSAETVQALRQGLLATSYDRDAVLRDLTAHNSTFEERHIWHRVAVAAQACGMGYAEIRAEVAQLRRDTEIVPLQVFGPARFTTREMQAIERQMVTDAQALAAVDWHLVDGATVRRAIEESDREAWQKGFSLSEEQRRAIWHITHRIGALQMIQGHAGAGKTTMLDAARRAWEAAGFRVHGAAIAKKAAHGLFHGANIDSQSLAALLLSLKTGEDPVTGKHIPPARTLSARDVIVIDEAGMVGSRMMQELLAQVLASGAKLVLVGDVAQLQAIDAGGAFQALQKTCPDAVAYLKENLRQRGEKAEDMKKVVALTRQGDAAKALEILDRHGLIEIADGWPEAAAMAVGRWANFYDAGRPQEALLLAATNAATETLNALARDTLKNRGLLDDRQAVTITVRDRQGKSLGQREIALGERLVFRANRSYAGILNNEAGTVTALSEGFHGPEITIRKDDGSEFTIIPGQPIPEGRTERQISPGAGYAQIEYAYAGTTHRNQGTTADHVVVFADGSMESREKAYVDLSRMRHTTAVVFARPDIENDLAELGMEPEVQGFDAIKKIIGAMSRSQQKDTSLDYVVTDKPEPETGAAGPAPAPLPHRGRAAS